MKAQDLRIGNFVNNYGEVIKLTIWDLLDIEEGVNDYKPIALNEQWLLTFGFTFSNNQYIGGKGLFLKLDKQFNALFNDVLTMQLTYVHQFQNLYYALTGTELEIKEHVS